MFKFIINVVLKFIIDIFKKLFGKKSDTNNITNIYDNSCEKIQDVYGKSCDKIQDCDKTNK